MSNRKIRSVLGVLAVLAALGGCGGDTGGQPAASSPAPSSAAAGGGSVTGQVTSLFQRFFNGTLPVDTKVAILQKGDQFRQVLQAQAAGPLAKSSGVKVLSVTQSTVNSAAVKFTVLLDGKPALENQAGGAVLDNGVWKVSASTYCTLLQLQGLTAPPCSGS
jgi:hypothetical protein